MKFNSTLKLFIFLSLIAICEIQCRDRDQTSEIKWDYSDTDVVGLVPKKTDRIDIDIYVDATTSMEGFAISNTSVYSQFLDQLEASSLSAWRKADCKFFKFGQIIKPVNRADFLSAKNDPKFYHETGIFLKTYIDSVVSRTDTKRLSVLITDLFQDEGDVNTMVEQIKDKCFNNGVKVGIIGVKSNFKGKVYDVPNFKNGYDLDTPERPFYAIVFGNQYNMEYLFEALKTKPFISENRFFIISNHIVKSYDVSVIKNKTSSFVNKKASRNNVKNSFDFSMKKKGTEAKFDVEITLNRNKRCADFSEKNLEIIVYKKSTAVTKNAEADSTLTTDVSIENLNRSGDKITGTLVLKNDDEEGNYSYAVYLKANSITGLVTPKWIDDFTTDNPIPNTPSAARTFNLKKFASTLLMANASVSPTYIAKFYINIFKQ